MAVLVSEVAERSWATDKYGDNVLSWNWDWRDDRIMAFINNFPKIAKSDTMENLERLGIGAYHARQKNPTPQRLKRSLMWRTFAASGGDTQVFTARYLFYAKFVELALGKGNPYNGPVPNIANKRWKPIAVPTRTRKAKPHVVTEMRKQAVKFSAFARKRFSFVGTMFMLYAMGGDDPGVQAAVNRAIFWATRKERLTGGIR